MPYVGFRLFRLFSWFKSWIVRSAGRRVLVVEDTSTTGGSVLEAVRALREAGAEVVACAVVVDRGTGAKEAVEAEGLTYLHAIGLADLVL